MPYVKCHNCGSEMIDTKATSFGTGEPIYKCSSCNFTALYKGNNIKKSEKPEDIFYDITNGSIKYADCKCVMKMADINGKDVKEITTYKADTIVKILREAGMLQVFGPGSTFTMEITFEK